MFIHLICGLILFKFTYPIILFEESDKLLTKVSTWNLVLDIDYSCLIEDQTIIEEMLQGVNKSSEDYRLMELNSRYFFNKTEFNIFKAFAATKTKFHSYQNELSDLLALLPKIKAKRGLINLGGSLLLVNGLFGVMDEDDKEDIADKFSHLNSKTDSIIFDAAKQLTIMRNINSLTINNTQNISKIIDHLGQYDKIIQSVYVEKYRDFNLTFIEIKNYLDCILILDDINSCIDSALAKVEKFKTGLNMLFLGKLTQEILPEETFLHSYILRLMVLSVFLIQFLATV
jgi:hypothetical protein